MTSFETYACSSDSWSIENPADVGAVMVATAIGTAGCMPIAAFLSNFGSSGATGASGLQGPSGSSGMQGIPGTQGGQGQTGSSGMQGIPGTPGGQGATGPQGIQGNVGSTGISGSSGLQGSSGMQGPPGQNPTCAYSISSGQANALQIFAGGSTAVSFSTGTLVNSYFSIDGWVTVQELSNSLFTVAVGVRITNTVTIPMDPTANVWWIQFPLYVPLADGSGPDVTQPLRTTFSTSVDVALRGGIIPKATNCGPLAIATAYDPAWSDGAGAFWGPNTTTYFWPVTDPSNTLVYGMIGNYYLNDIPSAASIPVPLQNSIYGGGSSAINTTYDINFQLLCVTI